MMSEEAPPSKRRLTLVPNDAPERSAAIVKARGEAHKAMLSEDRRLANRSVERSDAVDWESFKREIRDPLLDHFFLDLDRLSRMCDLKIPTGLGALEGYLHPETRAASARRQPKGGR